MPYLYVLQQTRFTRVAENEIMLLEGGKVYSTIVTASENILIRQPLTGLHDILGDSRFCQVHATYVVSLPHVVFFTRDLINLGNREVPIGRKYRADFYKRMTILNQ